MHCTLFDVTPGLNVTSKDKPRAATEVEVKAYFLWLQDRDNLPKQASGFEIHWRSIGNGCSAYSYAIGATFGRETARQEREQGRWKPAQFESGAYSIVMPGCNFARQRVIMEILDDAGDVVNSSTMPIEPKKGGVIWDRAAVRKAAGTVPKASKAKPAKISPPVSAQNENQTPAPYEGLEPVEALKTPSEPISQPVDVLPDNSHPVAQGSEQPDIAALLARMDALEARLAALPAQSDDTPTGVAGRAKRTPAHERAIRRAWAERRARREAQSNEKAARFQADLMRDTAANNNRCAQHHIAIGERLAAKRRRTIQTARRALSRSRHATAVERARANTLAAQLAKAGEDLARARLAPTYFDADTGAERLDITGRTAHHARTAIERADTLQARLGEASAAIARMQETITELGDQVETETLRRIKAEQALAAVTARKNGWPPAVQSVNVRFAS